MLHNKPSKKSQWLTIIKYILHSNDHMWLCSRLLVGFMSSLCVFHSATDAYLGVIFAWFRAGIHINQTTHAHVKPALIWFIISNHIQWSKQVTRSIPKSMMRRGIHTLCTTTRKERKHCEQAILSATWHMLGNTLYCFWIPYIPNSKCTLRNRIDKVVIYLRMILFKHMVLFQFCKLFNFCWYVILV